jgi:hypothetical protein
MDPFTVFNIGLTCTIHTQKRFDMFEDGWSGFLYCVRDSQFYVSSIVEKTERRLRPLHDLCIYELGHGARLHDSPGIW